MTLMVNNGNCSTNQTMTTAMTATGGNRRLFEMTNMKVMMDFYAIEKVKVIGGLTNTLEDCERLTKC